MKNRIPKIYYFATTEEKEKYIIDGYAPYAYFEYKGATWPVYDDDSGQCDCIYLDGKWVSGGTYCMYPENVENFTYCITDYLKKQKGKRK